MIALMLVLAVPSCFIEYKLTSNKPAVRAFFANHKLAALLFSTAVSAMFGAIFGAAGLIVFGAGMLSTMGMLVIYGLEPVIKKSKSEVDKNKTGLRRFGKIVSFPFKVAFGMVWIIVKVLNISTKKEDVVA